MKKRVLSFVLAAILSLSCISVAVRAADPWQDAYANFLRNWKNKHQGFLLRYFDNESIPYLIMETDRGIYYSADVYTYNGKVYKIRGQEIYDRAELVFSDNQTSPGLFSWRHYQADDTYDYWTVKNNELIREELWIKSYVFDTGETLYKEISSNKVLLSEAKKVFDTSNYLVFYEINESNIAKVIYGAGTQANPPMTATPSIKVILNGSQIQFDQPPIIDNGRTLVPIRAIVEAMGASVNWDAGSQTATIVKGTQTVKMQIGNASMTNNNTQTRLDVPPKIVGGRTLIPVRAISEAFGAKVVWDTAENAVYIAYKS